METPAQFRNNSKLENAWSGRRRAGATGARLEGAALIEALEPRQLLSASYLKQPASGTSSGSSSLIQPLLTRVAAPRNLTATAVSDKQVHLAWTLSTTSTVSGYQIFRSSDGITFIRLATVGATASSYSDLTVTEATTWTYHVRAITKSSGASSSASATVAVPLAAPTGLQVKPYANVPRVDLSWIDNSSHEAGYVVERSQDGVNFTAIASLAANSTTYSDTGLHPATTYTYRVRAYGPPADSANSAAVSAATAAFQVFDGTDFIGEPDFSALGYAHTYLADRQFLSNQSDPTSFSETATRALADTVAALGRILVLDVEWLPLDIRYASQADVQNSMNTLGQLIDWVHSEQPQLQVGFYDFQGFRDDYWTPYNYETAVQLAPTQPWWAAHLAEFTATYQGWMAAKAFLMPLANKVDFVCPSLYTYYEDQAGWQIYASANIQQARQYGKPVFAYLWMEFHDSTVLVGQEVPADYWQMELTLVRQQADGVVIWGGWKYSATAAPYKEQWDQTAAWWQITQSFLLAQ